MVKSNNTVQIIEQNIYNEYSKYIPMYCCNQLANKILNDFEANGFEVVANKTPIEKIKEALYFMQAAADSSRSKTYEEAVDNIWCAITTLQKIVKEEQDGKN